MGSCAELCASKHSLSREQQVGAGGSVGGGMERALGVVGGGSGGGWRGSGGERGLRRGAQEAVR